jgi:Holliday junction resolvasome RuvABC endonuclease subunit
MPKQPDTILAIDPGLRELGYAVLDRERVVTHGVIPLRRYPAQKRVREARKALDRWLGWYRPQIVVLEATHAHPTGTFQQVHALARTLAMTARQARRKTVSYPAQTVRKHLVGNGKAEKAAVARHVADRFPELAIYLTQDRQWKVTYFQNMYDAVALALYHRSLR